MGQGRRTPLRRRPGDGNDGSAGRQSRYEGFTKPFKKKAVIIWFSPGAKQFTNKDADALAKYTDVILVCGRYEGIDERAKKILKTLAPG